MRAERRGTRREIRYDFEYRSGEYHDRGPRRELQGRRWARGEQRRREERRRRDTEWAYEDREREPLEPIPDPWGGFYPPVTWGGGMVYGLEGGGPSPFALFGPSPYDEAYDTHIPPEEALRRERVIHERRRRAAAARSRARRHRRERERARPWRERGRWG